MKDKTKFVLVNHSILDFEEYVGEYQKIVSELKPEVFELVTKFGFGLVKIGKQADFRRKVVFYNKHLDMELVVVMRKKFPPEFV